MVIGYLHSFNRTIVELKMRKKPCWSPSTATFNRTIVELKFEKQENTNKQ